LLNARLAEAADGLEHAEEQIWTLYAQWQGTTWDGEIDYPDTFNIQDKYNDMNMLKLAKDAAPRSNVLHSVIEKQMLKIIASEEEYEEYEDMMDPSYMGEPGTIETPGEQPEEQPQEGEHPSLANLSQAEKLAHIQTMLMEDYSNAEILALHPEVTLQDIVDAGADAARNNN